MPELPEVETVVRGLRRNIQGQELGTVLFASRRVSRANPRNWRAQIGGHRVERIERRGKYIIVNLSGDCALVIHLRMTGRLWIKAASYRRDRHDRFMIPLADGRRLVLSDARQFARVDWYSPFIEASHPGLRKLGPDALTVTTAQLRALCSKSHRPIKSFLLDQTRLSGLGNIYADESLFAARIHPGAFPDTLASARIERLRSAIASILQQAIDSCGTTFDTFSDLEGRAGGFGARLQVYHRDGLMCNNCRSHIHRVILAGRSTHFCPRCQKP